MHSVRHFRSGGRANARKVQKRTMDKKGKQQFLLVAFGVALYAALMNLNEVAAFLTRLATLFTPVIIGLLMAFVLSVPMQGIAGRLTRLMPKAKEKHIDLLSLLLTLLCVVIVVVLLCVLALPQLAASLKSIGTLVRENWPDWARLLSDHGVDTSELTDRIARLTHTTYARFLSGQCVEVVILGTMIFLAFSLCGIPYAGLTAALTAAFAFVPYIGALASCAIGVLLTLLAQPEKALLCLIVYQAVQFTENQFIYPHVVGSIVGLAPLWTLLAALLGGKLFGLVGIVFFIPLTAVVLQLVHEHTAQQLSEKKLDREDLIE